MNLFEWYLNLTFWQAVLVWLKLLLPVLFMLTVAGLVVMSVRIFTGYFKLPKMPRPTLPKTVQSQRQKPTAQ